MKDYLLILVILAFGVSHGFAAESKIPFDDQAQYELLYEFSYQSNIVESFFLECTGDRSVSYKFAFATAPISNGYKNDIMGLKGIAPDPFANKSLAKRVWHEIRLAVTRNPEKEKYLVEPVLMAQKDVLRLMQTYRAEKDVLCDFVFWEEVLKLEDVTLELLRDAKRRKAGAPEFYAFEARTREGLPVLNRLFQANPLK